MNIFLQQSEWYQSLTLTERANILSCMNAPSQQFNQEIANKRFHKWSTQVPFHSSDLLVQRLQQYELSEQSFIHILGETNNTLRDRCPTPPIWLHSFLETFEDKSIKLVVSPNLEQYLSHPFLSPVRPFICREIATFNQQIQGWITKYPELPFDPQTIVEKLVPGLADRLISILEKTFVLELHVARLQGELHGNSSEERFEDYVAKFSNREAILDLFKEYPVLGQQCFQCIQQWRTSCVEFLERLCADWSEIKHLFSPKATIGYLANLMFGAGDRHNNGRSVFIAEFQSGLKLIYKPRSLALAFHFQSLLVWLNQHGYALAFQTLPLLCRENYGWIRYIETKDCDSIDGVSRFYKRIGAYIALLYVLDGTDFHHENLLACGEHPILIDLETLFVPNTLNINESLGALDMANRNVYCSVLKTGFLPTRTPTQGSFDVSGIGGADNQRVTQNVFSWIAKGTDQVRLQRSDGILKSTNNRPTVAGKCANILDYVDPLIDGFTTMYRFLWRSREKLLSKTSPLLAFAKAEVRVIFRNTQEYASILEKSYHPNLLRDALDRDLFFDKLWVQAVLRPHLKHLVSAEHQDLWRGDIPIFTTYPDSTALFDSQRRRIENFFNLPSIIQVQNNIKNLGQIDLERQIWFIKASLTTFAVRTGAVQKPYGYLAQTNNAPVKADELMNLTKKIGNSLVISAIQDDQEATWIGLNFVAENYCQLEAAGYNLYDGNAGIALYLAYLGMISADNRFTKLAEKSLNSLSVYITEPSSIRSIGAFDGWAGIIYLLTHLSVLWGRSELLCKAEQLVEYIQPLIKYDNSFDIISGSAGCINALLTLHEVSPSDTALQVAIQCGEHLLNSARSMQYGIAWGAPNQLPLAGFSHGVAGISWALFQLSHVAGRDDFHQAAINALVYEDSLFSQKDCNWADLRSINEDPISGTISYMSAWCHGAPGIALGRLKSLPYYYTERVLNDIEVAIQTTLRNGFSANHSLCHGDLGNIDVLLMAQQHKHQQWLNEKIWLLTRSIIDSMELYGCISGIPHGVETPGLMTGLAGIGYGLLRLAAPDRVPSVLTLEPPRL